MASAKELLRCILCFLVATGLLFGCATLEREPVKTVNEGPVVSKVLQAGATMGLKRKVAIARFSNETKYGQSVFLDQNEDKIGKQAMDILSARLNSTEKFILLERADLDKINRELEMGNLGKMKIAADYLVLGSISEFGRKDVSDVGVFSRVKKQVAFAKVNIRLVDVTTGQIVYSEEGSGEAFSEAGAIFGVGTRAGYDSSLNDKAISAAIDKLINNIVENLLSKPWRSYILAYQDGGYLISGGAEQGLKVGDEFVAIAKGKVVKNPQTGMPIELPGKRAATLRVDALLGGDPSNEVSLCSVVSGSLPASGFEAYHIEQAPVR